MNVPLYTTGSSAPNQADRAFHATEGSATQSVLIGAESGLLLTVAYLTEAVSTREGGDDMGTAKRPQFTASGVDPSQQANLFHAAHH